MPGVPIRRVPDPAERRHSIGRCMPSGGGRTGVSLQDVGNQWVVGKDARGVNKKTAAEMLGRCL